MTNPRIQRVVVSRPHNHLHVMRLMKAGGARAVKRVLVVLVAMMMVQVVLLGMDSLMVRANNKACFHCVIVS